MILAGAAMIFFPGVIVALSELIDSTLKRRANSRRNARIVSPIIELQSPITAQIVMSGVVGERFRAELIDTDICGATSVPLQRAESRRQLRFKLTPEASNGRTPLLEPERFLLVCVGGLRRALRPKQGDGGRCTLIVGGDKYSEIEFLAFMPPEE